MAVRFFIPGSDAKSGEDIYQWIIRYITAMMDVVIESARIYSITYVHGGQQFLAKVGEVEPRTGQLVIAILRADSYLICTPYYGVRRGEAISISRADVKEVSYFEGLDQAHETLYLAVTVVDNSERVPSLKSRVSEAITILETLTLDDFPAALAGDFLSLKHRLGLITNPNRPAREISEIEATDTAYAIRCLYVETLRLEAES
jgi:hypothetical protein